MKTFKLIKSYPNSPKLGTQLNYSISHQSYHNHTGGDFYIELPKHQIENFSEFWEEVVEKEWEILSFENEVNNQIHTKGSYMWDSGYLGGIGGGYDYCLKHYCINSVKNLKTGEVFTVGDYYITSGDKRKIEGIIIRVGTQCWLQTDLEKPTLGTDIRFAERVKDILFTTTDGEDIFEYTDREFAWVINGDYKYMLFVSELSNKICLSTPKIYKIFSTKENAEKWVKENTKQPLFVSVDGVEIFEGDKTYVVNTKFTLSGLHEFSGLVFDYKYFAEKEKAEEYILMNKPSLSLNDIIDLENSSRDNKNFKDSNMAKRFINFVKSRV